MEFEYEKENGIRTYKPTKEEVDDAVFYLIFRNYFSKVVENKEEFRKCFEHFLDDFGILDLKYDLEDKLKEYFKDFI